METVGRTHSISSTVPPGAEHTTRSRPRHEVPIAERHKRLEIVEGLARESFAQLPLELLSPTQLVAELSRIQKAVRALDHQELEIGWDAFVASRGDVEMRLRALESDAVHAEISRRIQMLAPPADLASVSDEELCWLEYSLIKANNGWLIESGFLKFAEFGLFEQYLGRVRRETRLRQASPDFKNHRTPWLAKWRFDEPWGTVCVVADYDGTKPSDFPAGSPTARERASNERRAHEVFTAAHGHPSSSKPTFAGTLLKPGFERFAADARLWPSNHQAKPMSPSDHCVTCGKPQPDRGPERGTWGTQCHDCDERATLALERDALMEPPTETAPVPSMFRRWLSTLLRFLGVAR